MRNSAPLANGNTSIRQGSLPWSTTRFSPEGRHHTDVGGRSGECEHIHRELASGKGFADLVLIPRKNVDSPAIILELKYNRDAEGAIAQILRKQYPAKVAQGRTYDETVAELKRRYDGYHFSDRMTDIYNPWSLIYAFDEGKIGDYWFSTGTPTSLINILREKNMDLPELDGLETSLQRFNAPTERIDDPVPVLYQSGYLTLKAYDRETDYYTLGFPNQEVSTGFANCLKQATD